MGAAHAGIDTIGGGTIGVDSVTVGNGTISALHRSIDGMIQFRISRWSYHDGCFLTESTALRIDID